MTPPRHTTVSCAVLWLAAGAAVGAFHFLSLRATARMLAASTSFRAALTLHLVRFPLTAGALVLIARHGAAPLLAATLGLVAARTAVVATAVQGAGAAPARNVQGAGAQGAAAMITSPLDIKTVFALGPVRITEPVVVTWGVMAALTLGSLLLTRRLRMRPGRAQATLELAVSAIAWQIHDIMGVAPRPYLPLIGTLMLFILAANWSSLIPGVEPPTGHIETDAALALIVLCAVIWCGIRARGLRGYLKTFAEPTFLMIPLNVVETFTRVFSLMVRLFGNVMSGAFIISIMLSLAGLIVPIPFMGIELLIGAIQAYIFAVLAMVFIGSAVSDGRPQQAAQATSTAPTGDKGSVPDKDLRAKGHEP